MIIIISRLTLLLAFFALTACGVKMEDKSPKERDVPVPQSSTLIPFGSSSVQIEVRGLPEPQKYQVSFRWPAIPGKIAILRDEEPLTLLSSTRSIFQDVGFFGGQTLHYRIIHTNDSEQILSQVPVEVKIPEDAIWNGLFLLNDNKTYKFKRLFLMPGTRVVTQQFNLSIEAEEIYSDNGTIENFNQGTQAAVDKTGRNGGSISIFAQRAVGSLLLFVRGEQGGNGRHGGYFQNGFASKSIFCDPADGKNGGHAGNLTVSISDKTELKLYTANEAGLGGKAGVPGNIRVRNTTSAVVPSHECYRRNAPVYDGKPGKKGQVEIL